VLLVGAGDRANLFIRALTQDRRPEWRVVGILSLRSRQGGRRLRAPRQLRAYYLLPGRTLNRG
jgi:FlaA1/EpsC-like NDP-sugar epimerase